MSFQQEIPGLFAPQVKQVPSAPQPATEKQLAYAESLAARRGETLPSSLRSDRAALSAWIDARRVARSKGKFDHYPSSKQVAFAERIARIKRRDIPDACFKDRDLMSRWIDGNLIR